MPYVCAGCGREARLPDFCCGQSMVAKGSYSCSKCGRIAQKPGNCCGEGMIQI